MAFRSERSRIEGNYECLPVLRRRIRGAHRVGGRVLKHNVADAGHISYRYKRRIITVIVGGDNQTILV